MEKTLKGKQVELILADVFVKNVPLKALWTAAKPFLLAGHICLPLKMNLNKQKWDYNNI